MEPLNTSIPSTLSPQSEAFEPAGFWIRFVAIMIDALILLVIESPLSILEGVLTGGQQNYFVQIASKSGDPSPELFFIWLAIFSSKMVLSFFYIGWFFKNKGATPVKLIFGMRVLDIRTGKFLSYRQMFVREFVGKIISTLSLTIGYLMAAFTKDKRALHDLIAGTQVLRKK
jgi:uncharacterized RDD family membrane protein YckC